MREFSNGIKSCLDFYLVYTSPFLIAFDLPAPESTPKRNNKNTKMASVPPSPLTEMLQDQDITQAFNSLIAQGLDLLDQPTDTETLFSSETSFDSLMAQDFDPFAQFIEDPEILSSNSTSSAIPTSFFPLTPEAIPSSPSLPALDLYSIKASICHHHIRYANTLPWSGSCLDFDTRYCDACRERERLVVDTVALNPAAGMDMSDLDAEMEMGAQDAGFEEAEGRGVESLIAELLPRFCAEGFAESPLGMMEGESLVEEEFDGQTVTLRSDLSGENAFEEDSSEGSSTDYQYLSSDSESGSALIGEAGRDNLSDNEGDDEADDELMSPDIGVSFPKEHFLVGEEFGL
ncbi:MAG: hypothetical protein HETSPECPRED_009651 [Heterodermia speciosa]|uniref:Uncharacterized protein n=1 Tax=Heterodermia speciosa TaxID=116794 RepID=A0A8H3EPC4_9LECA|nr:MAG: hypothetical protein HETSPECPRED_009651 [Heterodermia speciosa]